MNKLIWLLPAAIVLPACVTINIYFPEAAAERAADKIIEDVWQLKQEQQQQQQKPAAESPSTAPSAPTQE